MSKSRRKAAGCTRGRYKRKNMGKGWALARRVPQKVKPLVRADEVVRADSAGEGGDQPEAEEKSSD